MTQASPVHQPGLKVQWLRCFLAVAEAGELAAAAGYLQLTPGAVRYNLKQLENFLGCPLFDLQGRAYVLHPAAAYFYRQAKTIVSQMEEWPQLETRAKGTGVRKLEIASPWLKQFSPTLLHPLFQDSETLSILRSNGIYFQERLLEQEATFVLHDQLPTHPQLSSLSIIQSHFCLVAPPVPQRLWSEWPLLALENTPWPAELNTLRPRLTLPDFRSLQVCLQQGHWACWLPEILVSEALLQQHLIKISVPFALPPFQVVLWGLPAELEHLKHDLEVENLDAS